MEIDIKYEFLNLDGRVVREISQDTGKLISKLDTIKTWDEFTILRKSIKKSAAFTLKSACLDVLTNPPQEMDERTGRAKEHAAEHNIMLIELAREIYKSTGPIALSVDDVKLLKGYINKRYNQSPLIVTQALEILDRTDVEKKKLFRMHVDKRIDR